MAQRTTSNQPRPAILQQLVYSFLEAGGRHSAADISAALHLSDPRGHIRDLRNKGFAIEDEWRKGTFGGRYKVYYVPGN